jgi:hypothetical protein
MFPVYINNFNRLAPVQQLLTDFARLNEVTPLRVTIVDNGSFYPPLLEWYKTCPVRVIRGPNNGPRGWWGVMDHNAPEYVVCDPDVDISECPADLFELLHEGLKDKSIVKTGPGIRLDDLPKETPLYEHYINVETSVLKSLTPCERWHNSAIDTAFFMARSGEHFGYDPALRAVHPYVMRHLPYYYLPETLTDEDRHYLATLPSVHKPALYWSTIMQDSNIFATK